MSIKIIVATAKNGAIGKDNRMPWDLPEDLKYFKEQTMGHAIIMGRKTYDSIGKALPGRKNIVISRNECLELPNVTIYNSLESALAKEKDAFIMGGAEIYEQALPLVDYLYITHIDAEIEADRYFPSIDKAQWEKQSSNKITSQNGIGLEFAIYKRKSKPS